MSSSFLLRGSRYRAGPNINASMQPSHPPAFGRRMSGALARVSATRSRPDSLRGQWITGKTPTQRLDIPFWPAASLRSVTPFLPLPISRAQLLSTERCRLSTTTTWVYNSSASSTMGLDVFSDPRSTPTCNLADTFAPSGARRLMLWFFWRESQPEKEPSCLFHESDGLLAGSKAETRHLLLLFLRLSFPSFRIPHAKLEDQMVINHHGSTLHFIFSLFPHGRRCLCRPNINASS